MALFPLFFDTVNKKLVRSEVDASEVTLPPLNQEDGLEIDLTVLRRISNYAPFFSKLNIAGYSLRVSIGTAGVENAFQDTWSTKNGDTTFTGELNLATAAISALANGTAQYLEITIGNGTLYYRGQFPTKIMKSVYLAGALTEPAGDTALGKSEANRNYVRKSGRAGEGFTLMSEDGLKTVIIYLHNDGSVRMEPIT